MSRTFGGYIGLEQWPPGAVREHARPLHFSAGRAALAAILRHERPKRLHLPDHICGSVLRAVEACKVPVAFHPVNDQLLQELPDVGEGEMILLVDYFGVRTREVYDLAQGLGRKAIVDASMAFFSAPPTHSWWFTSVRKFFGLPDGATINGPDPLPVPAAANPAVRADHLLLALVGDDATRLAAYRANNAALSTGPFAPTPLSRYLFERLDLEAVRQARTRNFRILHGRLGGDNRLLIDAHGVDGAQHYPLHLDRAVDLRLWHAAGIFAPRLWPDVLERAGALPTSRLLTEAIVPLPIDQRYDAKDMNELAWRAEKLR